MKLVLELNEILEAKFTRLLEHEALGEDPESRALGLLEQMIDEVLQDYPDESWSIEEEFASLGELL